MSAIDHELAKTKGDDRGGRVNGRLEIAQKAARQEPAPQHGGGEPERFSSACYRTGEETSRSRGMERRMNGMRAELRAEHLALRMIV
jgi:hypothetical protein